MLQVTYRKAVRFESYYSLPMWETQVLVRFEKKIENFTKARLT